MTENTCVFRQGAGQKLPGRSRAVVAVHCPFAPSVRKIHFRDVTCNGGAGAFLQETHLANDFHPLTERRASVRALPTVDLCPEMYKDRYRWLDIHS